MKNIWALASSYLKNKFSSFTTDKNDSHALAEKNIVQYEQLLDVNYHQDLSKLQATLIIHETSGFSGDIRTSGSAEYIRFFVNTGNGYENAGLAKLAVYDEKALSLAEKLPKKHLVQLYYSNKSFQGKKEVKVKAILSWNEAPPADPNWEATFGNACEATVTLKSEEELIGELLDEVSFSKRFSLDYAF